jgi:hypothetical protein
MPPPCRPMGQVSFFVSNSVIYQCTAGKEATRLMPIMAMACHG